MEQNKKNISAVVVTHNRKELLLNCLKSLTAQTHQPKKIFIIDNASNDGTKELLDSEGWLEKTNISLMELDENIGGAGGFSFGLEAAINEGFDWIWLMDDDAIPYPNALEKLAGLASEPLNIYGSLAADGDRTSWLTTLTNPPFGVIDRVDAIPELAEVKSLPFLGFMIHRSLVEKIGLPDAGFFIAADDIEYCIRAQRSGAKIYVVGDSRIEHPKSHPYRITFFGNTITCLTLPPWKRYYDTRNRLLIARKHYGARSLFTKTIPGSLIRLCATLTMEPRKFAQLRAFFFGFIDGMLEIKGKRHNFWGIDP